MSARPLLPHWIYSRSCRLIVSSTLIFATLIGSVSPASAAWQDLWNWIYGSEPPIPPQSGVGRGAGPAFCPIAPWNGATIWSDRPTLIWQGSLAKVELWQTGQSEAILLASYTANQKQFQPINTLIPEELYQVTFDRPLPPGQYEWRINQPFTSTSTRIDFQITAPPQNAGQSRTVTLNLPETEAITQARWLAQQQHWADFWQTLLTVNTPSEELRVVLSNTAATACPILDETDELQQPTASQTVAHQEYKINGKANQAIEINLQSPEFATRLIVSDAQGNEIITAASDRANHYHLIETITFPQAGLYILRVEALAGDTQGDFRLIVSERFSAESE